MKIGVHNASGLTNASGNRQNEMGLSSLKKPDCVPLASYNAFFNSKNSWVASLDSNGLLSKKVMTTTGFVTSYGYRGCFLGFGTIETTVVTLTSTPDYSQTQPVCATGADGCGKCMIFAESVQLLYWPVSGNHNNSISSTEGGTFTTTSNGITFISPSVYLSYQNVWTSKDFCRATGKNHSGALLTLNPEDVSTRVDLKCQEVNESQISKTIIYPSIISRRINYADLNTPISANFSRPQVALNASMLPLELQGYCDNKTAIQPILLLPNQIRDLDPNWKDCDLSNWGTQDPPRPLRPVNVLSGPISSIDPTVSSMVAVPVALPQPHTATNTADQAPAATVKSTSTDGASASPSSPLDSPNKVSRSKDSPVEGPASPQPASKVAPTFDPQVFTTNAEESKSPSSKATPHDGSAVTSSDRVVSTNTNGIVAEGTTVAHEKAQMFEPTTQVAAPITFESMIFSAHLSDYVVSGRTLHPGIGITVSGTPILLDPSVTALVVGTHTTALTAAAALPRLMIGSQTLTADSLSHYSINGQLLTPGGAFTLSGTSISLVPSATALVIASRTMPLIAVTALPLITFSSQTIAPDSAGAYQVSGQSLTPGGAITVSGTPISLAPSATALIINSITTPLDSALVSAPALPPLTLGSHTFFADSSRGYQIMGHTLTPGGAITVSGIPISLAPSATALIVGTSTEILPPPSSTAPGLGELINSAFGHIGGSDASAIDNSTVEGNTSYNGIPFTGNGGQRCRIDWRWAVVPMMGGLCYVV